MKCRTRKQIDAQFQLDDTRRPEMYELFTKLAKEARQSGRSRYSGRAILHRMRWDFDMSKNPDDRKFKLANEYSRCMAEKLAADDPRFANFFIFRKPRKPS